MAAAIDACVRSLLNGTTMPARIVVIDNGSDPNWEAVFVREFPGVVIVRSPRNLGFAGALSATVADYALVPGASMEGALLVLNQDSELYGPCLARLEEALSDPTVGIACPLVVDHRGEIWARGGTIHRITGRARNAKAVSAPGTVPLVEVDYAPGCAMLVRAEVWRRAGGTDGWFFMYFEDADLALRVRKLGYRV